MPLNIYSVIQPTPGFLGDSVVKNLPVNLGDMCSIPGSGTAPEKGCILPWEIPWTEELGGLQSMGCKRVGHNLVTEQPQPAI